ncbi:MAG: metallophosphoesterase [Acidimicrobiales bacterium]
MNPSRRLEVFAVEPDAVQLSWGRLGPGEIAVQARPVSDGATDASIVVEADGGPGAVDLIGLTPDTDYVITVGGRRLTTRTARHPAGPELYRFMTLSDMHLGQDHFGLRSTMREKGAVEELFTQRCTRAALAEGTAWGAKHLIIKGDLVDRGEAAEYDVVDKVLAEAGLPTEAIPGNHEVKPYRDVEPADAFRRLGLRLPDNGLLVVDVPGLRLALVDSTVPGSNHPHLDHVVPLLGDALDGRPAMVVVHHHMLRLPLSTTWPPGAPAPMANRFLDAVAAAAPAALVVSGHTHRHRLRHLGPLAIAETGSPKDYPGTWTGYVVHEGGLRQVTRRVARPDAIVWTEHSRWAGFGLWGLWSRGTLPNRCFTLDWPT